MKSIFTLCLAALLAFHNGTQAAPDCVFERYTSLDGLPNNAISDIHQDSKGFVWLCTWYGLSRFDGYIFKNYLTLPGDRSPLLHNRFLRITEDVDGYLWLTTYDNKLYRFDRRSEQFTGIPHSLPGYQDKEYKVETYITASDGVGWVALSGAGLMRVACDGKGGWQTHEWFDSPAIGKHVNIISEGGDGRIWVASELGVACLTPDADRWRVDHVWKERVSAIAQTDGYVGMVSEGRLAVLGCNAKGARLVAMPDGEMVTAIVAALQGGKFHIGTHRSGVGVYDPRSAAVLLDRRDIGRVRQMVFDSHGVMWITTDRPGITRYRPGERDYKSFEQPHNEVAYFTDSVAKIVERNDVVWVKMNRVGFGYYDRARDRVMPFYNERGAPGSRFTNGVVCFTVDPGNVLWMSTQSRGLEKVTIIEPRATVFGPDGAGDQARREVRAMMTDRKGNIWAGTKGGGIYCYDSLYRLVRSFPDSRGAKPFGRVYTLYEDSRGDIWAGTKGDGIVRLHPSGGDYTLTHLRHDPADQFSLSNDDVYSITEDAAGRIWVATYGGGINLLTWQGGKPRFLNPANSFPKYPHQVGAKARYLLLRDGKTMLASTTEGVMLFDPGQDPASMDFTVLRKIPGDRHSLGNNDVVHMMRDMHGRVWLSTFGGGLNMMGCGNPAAPSFDIYASEEGLSSNIVFAAAQDRKGNIWLSTENGISCLSPSTGTFSNYSRYDGIPVGSFNEATVTTTASGHILFGGARGIYSIDPDSMSMDTEDYRLTFTSLQIRNREAEVGGKTLPAAISECRSIRLPYDYSIFRIEYASLDFHMQSRTSYMYKLEGYENDWNVAGKVRSASYSNIPPGKYDFRVRCFAEENPMLSQEIIMQITILPPPWRTVWAYLIYAVLGILIMWGVAKTLVTMFSLRQKVQLEKQMAELKLGFFTNISHELRSPLTLILGGIDEVGRRETLSERGKTNIRLAHKNAQRMLTMINQLLDFRKIVGGKMELKIAQTDICVLAREAVDVYRDMAAEHSIDLRLQVPSSPLMVWIDPARVESLIDNLLSNSFKFTDKGGVILLAVIKGPAEGRFTIKVQDTGVGISRENLVKLFDHFGQSAPAVWGNIKGSGIGLSLCREIVALHKGRIDVDSRQGEGTTFFVELPVGNATMSKGGYASLPVIPPGEKADPAAPDPETPATGDAVSAAPAPQPVFEPQDAGRNPDLLTVMVVEDNGDVRAFLRNLLSDDFNIIEAEDGAIALSMLRAGVQPDVVVTDLMMPNMDGIELTGAIREDFSLSHLPVIILTARSAVESRISATRYGADDYITKPFEAEHLMASIDNLVKRRRRIVEKYSAGAQSGAKVLDLSPTEIVVTDRDEEFIRTVMAWIEGNIENPELTIDQLASHMGMGRTTMYKKLKSLTGKSPVELIKDYRIEKARMLLCSGQFTVSEVAYKVGFSDPSYFSKCFKEQYGLSPVDFLKNQQNS